MSYDNAPDRNIPCHVTMSLVMLFYLTKWNKNGY